MRKLKYDLTVETNALLCPNPQEFFSRAYLDETTPDNFRVIPGIKSRTKLGSLEFDALFKEENCGWDANGSTLDAIDIDVCSLNIMAEICQFDVEKAFISTQLAKGSNGDFSTIAFMSYYWEKLVAKAKEERELIRWQGDTDNPDDTLGLCDGHLKKLIADSDTVKIIAIPSTVSNVIAELTKVVQGLPSNIRRKKADLRMYVSSDIAQNYQIATALGNSQAYVTEALNFKFIGITMIETAGLTDNTVVFTLKDNLIYAFDGENDESQLKAINLMDTVAEPVLRTRANVKMGFYHTNPTEIVIYAPTAS